MSATSHDEGQPPPKVTKSAGAARLSAFAAVAAVIVTAVIGWRTLNHSSTQDQQSAEQVRQQVLAQQSRDAKAATDALDAQYASAVTALGVADPTGRVNAVRTLVAFAKAHPVPYGEDAVQRLAVAVALWSPAVPRHAFVNAVPPEALQAAGQLRNLLQSLYPQPDGHTPKLTLANADSHGQSWGSVRMANAYAAHMDLRAANLTNDRMTGATLDDSSMTCANLAGARMQGASLRNVDLRGANLAGADLRLRIPPRSSQYAGAYWDAKTNWGSSPPTDAGPAPYDRMSCIALYADSPLSEVAGAQGHHLSGSAR